MDFETSVSLRIPEYNCMDSDKNNYFVSEKTKLNSWFNAQDESADTSGDDWE